MSKSENSGSVSEILPELVEEMLTSTNYSELHNLSKVLCIVVGVILKGKTLNALEIHYLHVSLAGHFLKSS